MMHRPGDMSPWAERALTPAEERIVRASPLTSLVGRSPRGPWHAVGPAGRATDADIRAAINRAAGAVILDGKAGERAQQGGDDG